MRFVDRLKRGWSAFNEKDSYKYSSSEAYYNRPDRVFTRNGYGNYKTIVSSLFTRIAIDASTIEIRHCKLDKNGRIIEIINSGLNQCFSLRANMDQSGRAFIQDAVYSLLSEGSIAIVPVYATENVYTSENFDVVAVRTGKILEWYPESVKVRVYNDRTGKKKEIIVPKRVVSIVENPLSPIINEPNSTIQRLIRKLSLLDITDENIASGKFNIMIKLPYTIKTESKRKEANDRRKEIEAQLSSSKYGIAYIDGTEGVVQLNRPIDNNLMKQVEYLTDQAFSQLGITKGILDGTADEKTMQNYFSRIIEPIVAAIVDACLSTFISDEARVEGESLVYFRDPFKLTPVGDFAEMADKLKRNVILTSNEIRQKIGFMPSDDPRADMLINSNMPTSEYQGPDQSQYDVQNLNPEDYNQ